MLPVIIPAGLGWRAVVMGAAGISAGLVLLYYANSRNAWAGLFLALLAVTLLYRRARRGVLAVIIVVELLLLVLVLFQFNDKGFGIPVRLVVWRDLIGLTMEHHFWLGYGINNTKAVLLASGHSVLNAHNLLVDVFVSTGLIGLLVFLGMGGACARIFLKRDYRTGITFRIGVSGLTAFGFISMFDLKFAGLQFIGVIAYFLGVVYSQSRGWKARVRVIKPDAADRK